MTSISRRALLVGAPAAAISLSARRAAAADAVTIQIALSPSGAEAPLFYAASQGWFERAGLDVQILDGTGSMTTIQQVAANQVVVGDAVLGAMAIAVARSAPVISIAGWVRGCELAVLVPEKSPIRTAADLKGKTLLLFTSSPWVPFVDAFFRNAGLAPGDVNVRYVAPSAMFGAYAAGDGDGIMSLGAYTLPIINARRPSRAIWAKDYGITVPGGGFFVSKQTLAEKPEALARLVAVSAYALQAVYNGHIPDTADAVAKSRPNEHINKTVIEQQLALYQNFLHTPATAGHPLGWQADSDWQTALKNMEESKLIPAGSKTSDYYTNDIVMKAQSIRVAWK